jgi:hypothetical protein
MSRRLTIIFDPEFGEKLASLVVRTPVWIVDSATNRPAVAEAWQRAVQWPQISVTVFRPADNLRHVLSQIGHPKRVDIVGLSLTDEVSAEFRKAGFLTLAETSEGFRAS